MSQHPSTDPNAPRRAQLPYILPQPARPIEPAHSGSSSAASPGSLPSPVSTPGSSGQPSQRPLVPYHARSRLTRVACDACRKRRIKCSGDRPRCTACVKNQDQCHYTSASPSETNAQVLRRRYETTREEASVYGELFEYLRTLPESQSAEVLHWIRTGVSISCIVRQVKNGSLLLQTSLVPETRLRYDFPYRTAMPFVIRRSDNAYLHSILYEVVQVDEQQEEERASDREMPAPQPRRVQDSASRHSPAYLKPYHAAELIDPRLSAVDVSKWTSVISDNEVFVKLLSVYFTHEYPTCPMFQKDTFLQAMIDQDTRFCSSLLVNAIMADACHFHRGVPNRSRYWDPLTLSYRFLAEAKRLWELEMGSISLVNAQAAMILNIVYVHNGLDRPGHKYLLQAVTIGHELGLFTEGVIVDDQQMSKARLFTAWGIFRWSALICYGLQKPAVMTKAPKVPLPNPDDDSAWFGELHYKYPLDDKVFTTSYAHSFKAWSDLRVIINDLGLAAHSDEGPAEVTADMYIELYKQLGHWFTSLPKSLTPKMIFWPSHFKLQASADAARPKMRNLTLYSMEYYVILITMSQMQILEGEDSGTAENEKVEAAARKTAAETLPYAVVRLETLVRLYYLRHSFESCDRLMAYFLLILVNIVMDSKSGKQIAFREVDSLEHLRSTLVLCLRGLADQALYANLTAVICKLLMDRQTTEDKHMLGRYISFETLADRSTVSERVDSAFPLDTGKASEDQDRSRLENLIKKYETEE